VGAAEPAPAAARRRPSATLLATLTLMLAGCAGIPTGPSVLVLPGDDKSTEQFRTEDARCRQGAASELQSTPKGAVSAQRRYDMAYMQCMYAEGNQIPVPGRGWRSRAIDRPPALPEGVQPSPVGPPTQAPMPTR
jgi:hypothetical protein